MTSKKVLMLDEVIDKLKEARKFVGNVPVHLGIFNGANMLDDNIGYECVDILYDENDVRLYNF